MAKRSKRSFIKSKRFFVDPQSSAAKFVKRARSEAGKVLIASSNHHVLIGAHYNFYPGTNKFGLSGEQHKYKDPNELIKELKEGIYTDVQTAGDWNEINPDTSNVHQFKVD